MKTLVWSPAFLRAFKRVSKRQPGLRKKVESTLLRLSEDPFQPALHTHKLKGELEGVWACSVDYSKRILFEFLQNPESGEEELLLLTIGTHDEVY